jgi:phospholipid transport system substrate-binding protein
MESRLSLPERIRKPGSKLLSLYALVSLLFLPAPLWAADRQPVELVKSATDKVLERLRGAPGIRQDPVRLNTVIQEYIVPHLDFVTLSRLALGKHWRRASERQRELFAREFGTLLIRTYSAALTEYAGQEVEYLPADFSADQRRGTVRTRIVEHGRAPLAVDYSVRLVGTSWKIYDLSIEGVSLAVNYRTSFAQQIRAHGIDGLIERLAARNAPVPDKLSAVRPPRSGPH